MTFFPRTYVYAIMAALMKAGDLANPHTALATDETYAKRAAELYEAAAREVR